MIEVAGLIKTFGFNPVLRGVNLHVPEGEFVTLVGSNGAGKTTLLRILATLARQDEGEVRIGGWQLPKQATKVRAHLGYISHQPLLYYDLTAAENLRFFAQLYDLQNRDKRVAELLKMVGLSARQRDPIREFSRGMLQRLAIARATLHQPQVLLLDEPYTGLDQAASEMLTELLAEQKGSGKTILMITHDFSRGLSLCDRMVVLNRGKIVGEQVREGLLPAQLLASYQQLIKAT